MKRLLLVIVSIACGWASGCATTWSPRAIPACYAPSGDARLDRERSYYAALIAASDRKYVIARTDTPRQLEIEYRSAYKPEQGHARWLIDVAPDASLQVQNVPAIELVSRKRRKRLEQWFAMLSDSTRGLGCRDLNWLRWEAQNRGLTPLVDGAADAAQGEVEARGSAREQDVEARGSAREQNMDAAGAPATAPMAPTVDAHAEQLRRERRERLQRERDEISLAMPIALLATGVALVGGSIGLAEAALYDLSSSCEETYSLGGEDVPSCKSAKLRRNLAIGAGAVGLVAIAALASGAPLLARRLRRMRAIGRELRVLKEPRIALGGGARQLQVAFSAHF
jgi:hypothetical protein